MNDTNSLDDFLDFSFDEDFAPTKAKLWPEGKPKATLESFGQTKIAGSDGQWAITPCQFVVTDGDYLAQAGRDSITLTYDLVVEVDPATKKPKRPSGPDDETNNNLRRFTKALAGATNVALAACIGKDATLIVRHETMKDKTKQPLLDDDGNPRVRAKVVAVGKA